jgi:DNA repair photolyase
MEYKNTLNKSKSGYGVGEWADYSYNIGTGCINNCRYCYARDIAVDISKKSSKPMTRADWSTEQVKTWKSDISQKANGVIMLPSMHDITETYLPTYLDTLRNLLKAGNDVLIVTKPRLACIKAICDEFTDYKDNILIRMTITSMDNDLSQYWEPGAPLPQERFQALIYAHEQGYQTSVSVEPMIDTVEKTVAMYRALEPFITEDIWFGKMNDIKRRVDTSDTLVREAVATIYENQSNKNIYMLYDQLKDEPKVRWKDSIRDVVKRAA